MPEFPLEPEIPEFLYETDFNISAQERPERSFISTRVACSVCLSKMFEKTEMFPKKIGID